MINSLKHIKHQKMYNNKKREYTSPEMEILNARVERGFAGSTGADNSFTSSGGNEHENDSYAVGGEIGNNFNDFD